MKYEISKDRKTLTIIADHGDIQDIREMPEINSDNALADALEKMLGNSGLQWIDPASTGDLTSAPMLGIVEYDEKSGIANVIERWAFMEYQTRSALQDLYDYGKVVFIS
jgi:hypothetical protein